ncbi:hypothetical protein M422DRAFT_55435 [Sphaerobolus stellatus SS14]|uniref:Uncharacterized protein n=1 Tax=Sphaerobolus stellatus (strain SS14) TaxID=990650 RepID=A0A0C9TXV0_SPHS4|nr:hypothetical protein M422DRAFT_55435 [Sphaerobolus stellatus SS14]
MVDDGMSGSGMADVEMDTAMDEIGSGFTGGDPIDGTSQSGNHSLNANVMNDATELDADLSAALLQGLNLDTRHLPSSSDSSDSSSLSSHSSLETDIGWDSDSSDAGDPVTTLPAMPHLSVSQAPLNAVFELEAADSAGKHFNDQDLTNLRAFAFESETKLGVNTFEKL